MKRTSLLAAIIAGFALFTVPRPLLTQDFTNLEAGLQTLLDSVVAAGSTPGVSLRVDVPAMAFAWSGASGVADIETGTPLTTSHPVRIASNTKTFVAAATLRLWEEGRLGLDDPISSHLAPELVEVLEADGYDPDAITIRHLLTHTSGLYDYADRDLYIQKILDDPMHRWTPEEQIALAMEWGDPYGPPGEVYRYSDTGYVVLGLVVESAYGRPLARALRELLNYDGLGLHSTWMETMEPAPTGAEERAHQYLGEVDTYDWDPSLDLYGGGGLASTPDDMAAFMRAVFTRGLYMRAATADTMLTTVAADRGGPELSGSAQVPGVYRMGVSVRDVGGLEVYMHTGFWGTMVAYFPGQDITISVAVTQQQSRAMFRVFLDALVLLEESAATD